MRQGQACLADAVTDVLHDSEHAAAAAKAWAIGDLRTVREHYGEPAFGLCLQAAPSFVALRDRSVADTVTAIDAALARPGKSVAIFPLADLLRDGGALAASSRRRRDDHRAALLAQSVRPSFAPSWIAVMMLLRPRAVADQVMVDAPFGQGLRQAAVGFVEAHQHNGPGGDLAHPIGEEHADLDRIRLDRAQTVPADEVEVAGHQPFARGADGGGRKRNLLAESRPGARPWSP